MSKSDGTAELKNRTRQVTPLKRNDSRMRTQPSFGMRMREPLFMDSLNPEFQPGESPAFILNSSHSAGLIRRSPYS